MSTPIVRIVRMSFKPEHVLEFLNQFNQVKNEVRAFDGCLHLALLRDQTEKNVFYTYSLWESEGHLALYRNSPLFEETWTGIKSWFNAKPQAYTLLQIEVVGGPAYEAGWNTPDF
jgi:quinol monooxygenase YgiN